ncbi:MAG: MoaD/ThiS family protein [Methanobrevibacter sp.]|uniref:MoaD/ThiS family protein n=1 Tax=Methanobrevibacter sp. TaxID=66852 RepID=UPI00386742AB|nr:MoaD/ThiS family protein [Methanobrevibacter sp.]
MSFNLKFKDIDEIRELKSDDYTINDLLNELGLSSQTIVAKQNGDLVHEESIINDGDEIKLVQIIYGG